MMRSLLPLILIGTLALIPTARAQQDPGKQVVGKIKVEVYHATDGDPKVAGKHALEVDKNLAERLKREKQTCFKHYCLLGSDTKELYRSYENWAEPVKPSDEIMVRFEAQSAPSSDSATLDLELWLGRKKIVKTDINLSIGKPLWVRGPTWRQGHLIISVSLLSIESQSP
ncbi:MAG: hypothetical protein ACO3SO_09930 [Luteolibacter sp.]|jgi:hypothetical protein